MRLRPGWRFLGILYPVDHGGLIAPLREPGHNPAMHAGLHEGPHGRLVTPYCAGSLGAISVAKDRNGEAAARLAWRAGANGLDQEMRQVTPTPKTQPSGGHEGHQVMT